MNCRNYRHRNYRHRNYRQRHPLSLLLCAVAWVLSIFSVFVPGAKASPVHRHALLIGISDYGRFHASTPGKDRLFPDLDCEPDVDLIQKALVHTFGFADPAKSPRAGEIARLTTPEQTTHTAILTALQKLVDMTKPGDIVYIHYSGHGDQVMDKTEPTGLDSTLVPADYLTPSPDDKTERSTNEISGKTLLSYVRLLQAKHPAQIALSFDSCHSASALRSAAPAAKKRGISTEEYADWYRAKHLKYRRARVLVRGALEPAQAQPDFTGTGYVVISACRNTDCAYETNGLPAMGRLSECLAHALITATPATTYRQVFDQVYATFHQKYPDQHPQLDSNNPDALLLGGTAAVMPPSYLVLVDSPGHYMLDAGFLLGMTAGSTFAIFSAGDVQLQHGTEIADAKITDVSATASHLQITRKNLGLTASNLSAAHAVETTHIYETPPLTLDAESLRQTLPSQAKAILDRLRDPDTGLKMVSAMPLAEGQVYDVAAAPISSGSRGAASVSTTPISLVRVASGVPISTLNPSAKDLPERVFASLQKEARYRYACGLGEEQAGLNHTDHIALRLIPSDAKGSVLTVVSGSGGTADQRTVLPLNGYFVVQVQNQSGRPLHLAVLDLESSGDISQVWPATGATAQDNIIVPTVGNTWKTLWVNGGDTTQPAPFQATSPDRDEMYKAVATLATDREGGEDEYVDFAPLTTRGASRGPNSPFSDLFGPAMDSGVRGTKLVAIPAGTWTVADCPFEVK